MYISTKVGWLVKPPWLGNQFQHWRCAHERSVHASLAYFNHDLTAYRDSFVIGPSFIRFASSLLTRVHLTCHNMTWSVPSFCLGYAASKDLNARKIAFGTSQVIGAISLSFGLSHQLFFAWSQAAYFWLELSALQRDERWHRTFIGVQDTPVRPTSLPYSLHANHAFAILQTLDLQFIKTCMWCDKNLQLPSNHFASHILPVAWIRGNTAAALSGVCFKQ